MPEVVVLQCEVPWCYPAVNLGLCVPFQVLSDSFVLSLPSRDVGVQVIISETD